MGVYSQLSHDWHHAHTGPHASHGSDRKQEVEFHVSEERRMHQRALLVKERHHDVELAVEWGLVPAEDAPRLHELAESEFYEDEDEFRRTVSQPLAKESFARLMRHKRELMEKEREGRGRGGR